MNEIAKAEKILEGRIMADAEVKGCEICHQVKEDVKVTIDPYVLDLEGEEVEMRLCDACYQARHDDV